MLAFRHSFLCAFALLSSLASSAEIEKINKLLYMYRFFYLPFSIDFREGKSVNEIQPYLRDPKTGSLRMIKAEEMQLLDSEWNAIKEGYRSKSLLLRTPLALNESNRISTRLASHYISVNRKPFDGLSIEERIQVNEALKGKNPEVQSAYRQLSFLKSFLSPLDEKQFNFFIVSASWCESCREYRVLLESYFKAFPKPDLNIHSVVIEDAKEEIFDKPLLKELFPHPEKYSHDSIPRFLVLSEEKDKVLVLEEGEALGALYERYFKTHRGYLDKKSTLFAPAKVPTSRALSSTQEAE